MTTNQQGTNVLITGEYELRGGLTPHSAPIEDIGRIVRLLREGGQARVSYRMTGLASTGPEVYTLGDVQKRLTEHLDELVGRVAKHGKMPVDGRIESGLPTTAQESFDVHFVLRDTRTVVDCARQDIEIGPTPEVIDALRNVRRELEKKPEVKVIFRIGWSSGSIEEMDASDEVLWFKILIGEALGQTAGRTDVKYGVRGWQITSVKNGNMIDTVETFVVNFTRGQ